MEDRMKRLFLIITLLAMFGFTLFAGQVNVSSYQNEVRLVTSSPDHTVLQMTLGQFGSEELQIKGETWYDLSLKNEGLTLDAGYPQVPILARSIIIPNAARMTVRTIASEYVELPMPVAPSKGNLTRNIDPASIPFGFADYYQGHDAWPAETSYLTEPFIIRDYRGITVRFQPFVYYPDTRVLRVYTKLQVAVDNVGTDYTNSFMTPRSSYAAEFSGIYESMFLNFADAKYPLLAEQGRILVIKHSMFDATIQPWVDWKRQNGYQVDIVDVTVAGPTATQIQQYIQAQYNLNNGLMFVQIMGDAPQVPTLTSNGGGSDPSFALLAGGDSYPDIYVGRFSAQTTAEMQTQIQRTVYYERDIQSGSEWLARGTGIASNQGGGGQGDLGESDQTHIGNIRTDLLTYGYTSVDQVYEAQGATAAMVATDVNQGRGIINYCGHGSDTYWVTTGFSNTNVNALVNDNMLPFIVSVACVNGNFVSQTCFAEAWLRSVNETTNAPAGAIAMYASTVNMGWNPPMRGQDETNDLLVAETRKTVGGLFFNGSSKMIEVYGTSGISEYKNWTIFGDCSLMVRTKDPQPLTATYNPVLFLGMGSFQVETIPNARVTLSGNGTVYASGVVDVSGILILNILNPPLEPMDLTLTITAFNKVTYSGIVQVLPSTGPYIVVDDMTVTDTNNNVPEFGETVTLNFSLDNVGNDTAVAPSVTLSTNDQYLTILNATEVIPDIVATGTGGTVTGFQVQVASNVPDQYSATVHVLIQVGASTYEYNRSLLLNAPAFTWGGIDISDVLGNSNGMVDPGESVTLSFPFTNTGHAAAANITTAIVIVNGMNVAEPEQTSFTSVAPGETVDIVYFITFSSQIPAGSTINISSMLFSGDYSSTNNYALTLGIVSENFESDFSGFPWMFTGGTWTTEATSYNGSYCGKSATITHSQSTSMTVTLISSTVGSISFWKKVSSEQNYDYLKFYINGIMRNQWSGTTDNWSLISYDVSPGANVYKWEYIKDSMVSAGSDCAWIDDIIFPSTGSTSGAPIISVDSNEVNFGNVLIGTRQTLSYTINNTGNATLLGSVTVDAPFSVYQGNGTPNNMIYIVVPAQSFLTFNVDFQPAEETDYSGSMVIATDDPVNPAITVALTGSGQPVANDDPILPAVTELKGNYPNPFNPTTTIAYSIKETSPVLIEIYNVKGQIVRTLVKETKAAGNYTTVFDGRDDNHRALGSGIYFFKMFAGKYSSSRKMVMMK
jgi:hypothetical protein